MMLNGERWKSYFEKVLNSRPVSVDSEIQTILPLPTIDSLFNFSSCFFSLFPDFVSSSHFIPSRIIHLALAFESHPNLFPSL